MSKPALTALPPSKLQQARKVAGYAALAVGAGVAMTALAVDVTDAAIAGAVLAAGDLSFDLSCTRIALCLLIVHF